MGNWTIPNTLTSDPGQVNLITTEDGTTDYAIWATLDGELMVGKRDRATEEWGVDHEEVLISGDARQALAMPFEDDGHNSPSIARDGLGYLYIWANMHNDPNRQIKSVNPDDITAWEPANNDLGDLPNCTYPTPMQFSDGSIFFYYRTGRKYEGAGTPNDISGRSNSQFWYRGPTDTSWSGPVELFRGLTVPNAKGPGVAGDDSDVETQYNWSAYPLFYVESWREPHPDRLHMYWLWRSNYPIAPVTQNAYTNSVPSYAYSDDKGLTWKAIDGSDVTLPIDPINTTNVQMGLSAPGSPNYGWINGGGLCVDPATGYPQIMSNSSPWYHIRWNGSQWVRSQITWTGLAGRYLANSLLPYYIDGPNGPELWVLTPDATVNSNGGPNTYRYMMAAKRDGTAYAKIGDKVPIGGHFGNWESRANPVAYRLFRTIEVLIPNGNSPRVFTFGQNARARVGA